MVRVVDIFIYITSCYIIHRDRVVQLYPPASPYIKKSFEGILMYEIAGGFINKIFNYADPIIHLNPFEGLFNVWVGSATFRCLKILPPARS